MTSEMLAMKNGVSFAGNATSSAPASPVKVSVSQAKDEAFWIKLAARYSSKLPARLNKSNHGFCCLKTSKGFYLRGGQTFRVIISTLVGYDVEWQVLNSQDFSVPQHRERVYLVGHLRGKSRRKIFPLERKVREVHLEERKNRGSALQDGQVAATV